MSLKVIDVIDILEEFAPLKFKEQYDNVGLMVGDKETEITSILVALDCTLSVIEEAKEKGCNLILTHHPLLFNKQSSVTTNTLIGKKIIQLIRSNISVYSSHTNLDVVKEGMNEVITEVLGFPSGKIIDPAVINGEIVKEAGVGRFVCLEHSIPLSQLVDKVKESLHIACLRYSGEDSTLISKIAIINGSGKDYMAAAVKFGAECIITGDTTYHYVSDYAEMGISIIDAGHFPTEWPALKMISEKLKNRIRDGHFTNSVILSECTKDPYKYK